MKRSDWSRLALTSFLGVALSSTFVFLAALPIRHLRVTFGRKAFAAFSLLSLAGLAALGQWPWFLGHFSLCLLVGSYREFEVRRFGVFIASFFSLLITLSVNLGSAQAYAVLQKQSLLNMLQEKSQPLIKQMQQMPRFEGLGYEDLVLYFPSAVTITLMLILFISLSFSRLEQGKREDLVQFQLPDTMIWVFIGSLAAGYISMGIPWLPVVAKNILWVTLAAYFFQGLAVFTHYLNRLSVYGIWRMLAYFIVFFQMFLFISGLGLLDYWFDFRATSGNLLKRKKYL